MRNERVFKKGSYIFLENDENSNPVFFVKEGRVSHLCSSPGLSSALKDAGKGDFFGFISSFSGRPRLSSAIAVEDTIVVQLEKEKLFLMLREQPGIAMKIMSSYSYALKHYDSVLLDINPISLIYPQNLNLMRLGEFYMETGESILAQYIFYRYIQLFPDSENITDIENYISSIEKNNSREVLTETEKRDQIYRDGSVIFCEYESGDLLYFIREGKVKIMKHSGDREMLIAVLKEGEIFGELALITSSPRSATAISFGGVSLTPVDMSMFKELLVHSPDIIEKILTSISQRLWFNHIRLSHRSYRNPITRLFAFLESKMMEDNVSLSRKLPHQFQFGIDELIKMNELSPERDGDAIDELVNNQYLSFNFGLITVSNPAQFSSVVQMYKQRDHYPFKKSAVYRKRGSRHTDNENICNDDLSDSGTVAELSENIVPHNFIEEEIIKLIPDLNDEDPSKRVTAVIRLGSLGDKAGAAVPSLRERLNDDVKVIRKNAARSILKILSPGESFNLLREALNEKSQEMRSSAVAGLGELNIADKTEIIGLIIKSLKDKSSMVRISALRSISSFGSDAESAIPILIRLLSDSESSVRILSVNSLERITWSDVYMLNVINGIKSLSKNDPDKYVKNSAKDALIKLNRRRKIH